MGTPAEPTSDELVAANHLAEEIVLAVQNDASTPIEVLHDVADAGQNYQANLRTKELVEAIDHRLLVLAQLVIRQDREIELLRSVTSQVMAVADAESNGPDHQSNLACEEQTNCDHCNAEMTMFAVLANVRTAIEELRRG